MPIVQMPDGTQVNFPDTMSREEIKGMIQTKFPETAPKPSLAERARQIYNVREAELDKIGSGAYDQSAVEDVWQGAGQVAGTVTDIAGEAVMEGLGAVDEAILGGAGGEYIGGKLQEIASSPEGQEAIATYQRFVQENPRTARNLAPILPVLELGGLGAAAKPVAKAGSKVLDKAIMGAGETAENRRLLGVDPIFEDVGQDVSVGNIKGKVRNIATAKEKEVANLYKQAQELGQDTFITGAPATEMKDKLSFLKTKVLDDEGRKIIDNASKRIDEMLKTGNGLNMNELAGLKQGLQGGKFAEGRIKGIIDETIETAVDAGSLRGNPQAGELWKQASTGYRDLKSKFDDAKKNPLLKSIVEQDLTDEDLAAKLFGAGSITKGSARKAGQRYDEIVSNLGKEFEPELKRAVVGKIFNFASEPSAEMGDNAVWLQRVAREVQGMQKNNKTLWNKFSPNEQKALEKMAFEAQRSAEGGVVNKAVNGILNLANGVFGMGGLRTDLRLPSAVAPKQIAKTEDVIEKSRLTKKEAK